MLLEDMKKELRLHHLKVKENTNTLSFWKRV